MLLKKAGNLPHSSLDRISFQNLRFTADLKIKTPPVFCNKYAFIAINNN